MKQPDSWWNDLQSLLGGPIGGPQVATTPIGGYTGAGPDGRVQAGRPSAIGQLSNGGDSHEGEYVFDADATAAIGVELLDALRQKALAGDPNIKNQVRQAIGMPQQPGYASGGLASSPARARSYDVPGPEATAVSTPPKRERSPDVPGAGATAVPPPAPPITMPNAFQVKQSGATQQTPMPITAPQLTTIQNQPGPVQREESAARPPVAADISQTSVAPVQQQANPATIGQPSEIAPIDDSWKTAKWYYGLDPITKAQIDKDPEAQNKYLNWYKNAQDKQPGATTDFSVAMLSGWKPSAQDYMDYGLQASYQLAQGNSPLQRSIANQARQSTGAANAEANAALRNEAAAAGVKGAGLASLYGVANRNAGAQTAAMEGAVAKSALAEATNAALGLSGQAIAAQNAGIAKVAAEDAHKAAALGLTVDQYGSAANLIAKGADLTAVNSATGLNLTQAQYDQMRAAGPLGQQGVQSDPGGYIGTSVLGGKSMADLESDPSMIQTAKAALGYNATDAQVKDWIDTRYKAYLATPANQTAAETTLTTGLSSSFDLGGTLGLNQSNPGIRQQAALSLGIDPNSKDPADVAAIDQKISSVWDAVNKPLVQSVFDNLTKSGIVDASHFDTTDEKATFRTFIADSIANGSMDKNGQPIAGKSITWPWNDASTFYHYTDWNGKGVTGAVDPNTTVQIGGKDATDGSGNPITFSQMESKWNSLGAASQEKYFVNGKFDSVAFIKDNFSTKGPNGTTVDPADRIVDGLSQEAVDTVFSYVGDAANNNFFNSPRMDNSTIPPKISANGTPDPTKFTYYDKNGTMQAADKMTQLPKIYAQINAMFPNSDGTMITPSQFAQHWNGGQGWSVDENWNITKQASSPAAGVIDKLAPGVTVKGDDYTALVAGYDSAVKAGKAVPTDVAGTFFSGSTVRYNTAGGDHYSANDTAKAFVNQYKGKIVKGPNGKLYEVVGLGSVPSKEMIGGGQYPLRGGVQGVLFRDIQTGATVDYANTTGTHSNKGRTFPRV